MTVSVLASFSDKANRCMISIWRVRYAEEYCKVFNRQRRKGTLP